MSLNYTELYQAIQDYLQYSDPVFLDNLDLIIRQAEDRIYQSVQAPVNRKNATSVLVSGNQYVGAPTDMLSVASFAIISGASYTFMLPREVGFIREAYPFPGTTGAPKVYAFFDQTSFILGPTPNTTYSVELNYHAKPESITTSVTGTSWIGQNFESILLSACILEGYIFLKGDKDLIDLYDTRYKEALSTFQLLGEGLDERDSFRSGSKRTEVAS